MNEDWNHEMTDEEFVEVSKPYFDMKGLWDLHQGICLLAKMNPKSKKPIVGTNVNINETDPTIRYYKYALEAIQTGKGHEGAHVPDAKLQVLEKDSTKVGAKQLSVNPRSFVKWATTRWSDWTNHLKLAEAQYLKIKFLSGNATKDDTDVWSKLSREEKETHAEGIFFKMVQDSNLNLKTSKGKYRRWAKLLNYKLGKSIETPYSVEKLRKLIPEWINQTQN